MPVPIFDFISTLETDIAGFYRRLKAVSRLVHSGPLFDFMASHSEGHAREVAELAARHVRPELDQAFQAPGAPPEAGPIDPACISPTNELYQPTEYQASARSWTPREEVWGAIKRNSVDRPASITVWGFSCGEPDRLLRGRAAQAAQAAAHQVRDRQRLRHACVGVAGRAAAVVVADHDRRA